MTQQGVRWSAEQVLALAPDAASRKAGSKLAASGPWSGAGSDDEGAVWGLCKGSGSTPYRAIVDMGDPSAPAFKCSCPSRKFPCKHALGLLLLWSGDQAAVPGGQEPPDWVRQWLDGRRQRAERKETAAAGGAAVDAEAARKRAERRAARIDAGAGELERRLADLLRSGLAGAEQAGYALWEETAARMVDAQAPGLAARVRELGAIPGSGPGWPVRLLEECALLHTLVQGWLHRERLPARLAATVGARVGLPASADGPAVRDRWLVLAQYDTADARLTTRRIWVHGEETGRTALLLSYGAAGRAPELALPTGLALDAELSTYPGGGQPRVALVKQFASPAPSSLRPAGLSAAEAAALYGDALRDDPWLETVPVTLEAVVPVPHDGGWQLADPAGRALPVTTSATSGTGFWRLVSLSGGAPLRVFGEYGHRGFTPLTAWPAAPGDPVTVR
ncbi:SWIM zinc finger family protein [Streptomyces sp. NPDC002734]|uniref:SWIM zinc finger family protein n=1 Tax=Streptomyces sp. NPDC002734 TaxID=3154426 RepID=UPI0033324272